MLDKRITLSGFDLDYVEKEKANTLFERYAQKIEGRVNDYEQIKVTLKTKPHAKTFLHEVHVQLVVKGKVMTSQGTSRNLYTALSDAFEKILTEVEQNFIMWKEHKGNKTQK